jgi:PAS domain S-box-containing protein
MLRISTLGGLSISLEDVPLADRLMDEAASLLVYLASTQRPHTRQALANLLWGEEPPDLAQSHLDQALTSLREQVGKAIALARDTVRLRPEASLWLDAHELEASIAAGNVDEATALYHGPFLQGFLEDVDTPYRAWLRMERTRLHGMIVDALATRCAQHLASGDLSAAMTDATRLQDLSPRLPSQSWRDRLQVALCQADARAGIEDTSEAEAQRWRAEWEQARTDRERLLTTARAQSQRQAALLRLSADLGAALDEPDICRRVVQGLHDTLGYDVLALMMVDPATGDRVLAASVGFEDLPHRLRVGQGLSQRPLADGQLHYTPDVTMDPRYVPGLGGAEGGGAEVDVPVPIGGEVLGVLIAESQDSDSFGQDDFEVLTAAAQQAGLAIGKARLLAAERRRANELDALRTTLADITAELDLTSLLQAIVARAAGLLHATGGELGLYDRDKDEICIVASHNLGADYVGSRHALGEGAMGRVAQTGKPMIIHDYQSWEGHLAEYPQVHGVLVAPLKVGGRLLGVFTTATTDPARRFTPEDLYLLNLFAQQAAIAVQNAHLYEQAQREISERARAEGALRQYQEHLEDLVEERTADLRASEKRYRSLFDGVPVGIYRTTPAGQIVAANQAQVQMLGYPSREALLATTSANLYVDPDERAEWQALMEWEGVVRDFEVRFRRYDGTVIWVNDTARAVKDANGQVLYYEGSLEDITERKQTERKLQRYQEHLEELVEERTAELQASEERYRTLFDGVPVGLYRTTPDGQLLDANQALVEMAGFPSRDAMLAANGIVDFYVDPADRSRWQALMEREELVRDFEFRHRRYGGEVMWVRDTARVVKDEQGKVLYYEGSLEDITERRELQAEIRRQKDYYEALFLNSPVAVVTADLQGNVVSWNPMAETLFGYSQEEVVGKSLNSFVANHPLLQAEAEAYGREVLNLGRVQATTQRTGRDGSRIDVDLLALPLVLAGEAAGFIAIYHDITERKQFEEELRHQKEYYEALFINNPVAVVTADLEGNIVSWNPMADRLFGYRADEVINRPLDDFVAADESLREEAKAYTDQAIHKGRVQVTTRRTRRDGSMVDVELLALPVVVAGQKVGFIAIYVDITDLQETRRQAEAANQAKSAFLASMSHELRTPLNAILGFTQLMDRDPNLTPDQVDYLGIINRSGSHLLSLINDVLEMSKIEAGKMTLRERRYDLYRQLDGLEEVFGLRAREKGLDLTISRADEVPQYIAADEAKLGQVLSNLLGNAVKFTREGGIVLRVGLSAQAQAPGGERCTLRFEVEDTGPGIAPHELPAIFEAFVQSETGRSLQEGTGLGLTISREFVRLMGGDLEAVSEVGQGSCFYFAVQVGLAVPDDSEPPSIGDRRRAIALEAAERAEGGPYRMLVVDERPAARLLLVKLLEPLGFDIREAENGQEAIEVWERWAPHLIWMDMRMPVMDGYEATRRIKARPQGQSTVIVAVTASAFEEDRERILAIGCNDVLRKPYREEEVLEILARHLDLRFVYDESVMEPPAGALDEATPDSADEALIGRFAQLPSEWLDDLRQATILGDLNMIRELVTLIGGHDAELGSALSAFAHQFEHDTILMLIRQAGEEP